MRNIFSYSDECPEMIHEVLSGSQDKHFLLIMSKYGNQHFLLFLLNGIDLISIGDLSEKIVFYVRP